MNQKEIKNILDGIAPVLKGYIDEQIAQRMDADTKGSDDIELMIESAISRIEIEVPEAKDGRDALDIEILPTISADKSYPRGTFATYKGGLWRAMQQTTGEHGWECVVNGLNTLSFEQTDREGVLIIEDSKGVIQEQHFKFAGIRYCGVFKDGTEYESGDVVTLGGSMWHCGAEKTSAKPGNSDDWRLCVKKGRDGK